MTKKVFLTNDIEIIKMFNKTAFRGWYHHKRRVRKKNYARAQRMLDVKRIKKKLGMI